MKKYLVTFKVYASHSVVAEAEGPEEAAEIAENETYAPCLCHQCADKVDISDIGEVISVEEVDEQPH